MHQCLVINEILSIVFQKFFNDSDHSALAVLARTCRAFSEPALDLLWREIVTFGVIVQCMPFDLWSLSEKEDEDGEPMYTFTRPLVEEDWIRFQYYAARVRVFGGCRFTIPILGVHKSALLALSVYRPVKTLLPNLHSLFIGSHYTIYTIPFSQAFLGPTLHTIHAADCDIVDASTIDSLCTSALRLSPNIKRINVNTYDPTPTSFYDLIHTLKALVHVTFPSDTVSVKTIEHLSRHRNLRELTSVRISKSGIPYFTTTPNRFQSLEQFDCTVPDWPSATTLMSRMQCHFSKLSIFSERRGNEALSSILELTRLIGQHSSQSSLTRLTLSSGRGTTLEHEVDSTTIPGLFEPLFHCTALRELQLIFSAVAKLDDAWLTKASFAWPLLQRLILNTVCPEPSKITLAGLVPLVRRCPDLVVLTVGLRASPISPRLLDGACNPKLKNLTLVPSTIESPGRVVHSLVRLFPSLKRVSFDSTTGVHANRWKEVNKMLHNMAHE